MIESPDSKSNANKEEVKSYSDSKVTNIKHRSFEESHQQSISEYALSYRETEPNNLHKYINSNNSKPYQNSNYHVEITIDADDAKKSIFPTLKNDENLSNSLDASVDENCTIKKITFLHQEKGMITYYKLYFL